MVYGSAHEAVPPGWRAFRSNTGRWWATRERPWPRSVAGTGVERTVDGDDEIALARAIAEQEARAALAGAQ
ncbi:hypothetical protein AB0M95_27030 [Sphaerisporangium sp. NPDC051017]|uniref:hypothetical protein n=1 Tax=Sphaerisporangium sp. NPDC051017 TaxID=3154636 RepID=UPI003439A7C2